jgi:hypothetical protein
MKLTVPPGLFILLATAAVVVFVRSTYAPVVGALVGVS